MVRTISNILWPFLAAGIALGVAHCSTGCKPPNAAAAEAEYTAELLACVGQGNLCVVRYCGSNPTADCQEEFKPTCSAVVKDCRREVNEKWGLCKQPEWPYVNICGED